MSERNMWLHSPIDYQFARIQERKGKERIYKAHDFLLRHAGDNGMTRIKNIPDADQSGISESAMPFNTDKSDLLRRTKNILIAAAFVASSSLYDIKPADSASIENSPPAITDTAIMKKNNTFFINSKDDPPVNSRENLVPYEGDDPLTSNLEIYEDIGQDSPDSNVTSMSEKPDNYKIIVVKSNNYIIPTVSRNDNLQNSNISTPVNPNKKSTEKNGNQQFSNLSSDLVKRVSGTLFPSQKPTGSNQTVNVISTPTPAFEPTPKPSATAPSAVKESPSKPDPVSARGDRIQLPAPESIPKGDLKSELSRNFGVTMNGFDREYLVEAWKFFSRTSKVSPTFINGIRGIKFDRTNGTSHVKTDKNGRSIKEVALRQTDNIENFQPVVGHESGHVFENSNPEEVDHYEEHSNLIPRESYITKYSELLCLYPVNERTIYNHKNENYPEMITYYLNPDSNTITACGVNPNPYIGYNKSNFKYKKYLELVRKILKSNY